MRSGLMPSEANKTTREADGLVGFAACATSAGGSSGSSRTESTSARRNTYLVRRLIVTLSLDPNFRRRTAPPNGHTWTQTPLRVPATLTRHRHSFKCPVRGPEDSTWFPAWDDQVMRSASSEPAAPDVPWDKAGN